MVELQMGLNRDKRRLQLERDIKKAMDAGHERMFLLVPEQTTFIMQRELVRVFGPVVARHIEVIDFMSLYERVTERCGGKKKLIDKGAKALLMGMVANAVSKDLTAYKGVAYKPEFISSMLDVLDLFANEGVQTEDLRTAAKSLNEDEDPLLARKLNDMATIIDAYLKMAVEMGHDPESVMDVLPQLIAGSGFLAGTRWFIDGFLDFTNRQKSIIESIIQQSESVTISLPCAGLMDERPSSAFAVATGQAISILCKESGIEIKALRTGDDSSESPALSYTQSMICESRPAVDSGIAHPEASVRLFEDTSVYTECQHIAGTILQAVRNGYRYRDISLVLCDYERYASVLEGVFARYNIPLYLSSRKEELTKKPVILAICSALDSATHGMQTEDVLTYLKSGFSPLTREEVSQLENYILLWRIRGRGWEPSEEGWMMHPDGFGMELDEAAEERLRAINEYRTRGVGPLLRLKEAMGKGKSLQDYVLALDAFLADIQFPKRLQAFVDQLYESGEAQTAQEYAQVYDVVDSVLEQICVVAPNEERPAADFGKLFRLNCATNRIATVPPIQDQVVAYTVSDARYFCSKIRYIVGADELSLPMLDMGGGMLNAGDIDILAGKDIRIPGSTDYNTQRCLSDIAITVSGAKKMLVFSYNTQGDRGPSSFYLRVEGAFPTLEREAGAGEDRIYAADLMDPKNAGALMGKIVMKPRYADIAFTIGSMKNETIQKTAMQCMDCAGWALEDLSEKTVKGLYGETVSLSASRVDTYSACRYNYFLKYGLGLRYPSKSKLAGPVIGSFYHAIIENVCRDVDAAGGFQAVGDSDIQKMTRSRIKEYTLTKMKGMSTQSERNEYLYRYMCREVSNVVQTLAQEFRVSDFHPTFFELKIGGEAADLPAIEIKGKRLKGKFTGRVDRVDTYTYNGNTVIRVNDYKTGSAHLFSLTDILCGQGMQLLVYNSSLLKDGLPGGDRNIASAGVLYTPAKFPTVASKTKLDKEQVSKERTKMLKRDGMLLNDKEILHAMEHFDETENPLLPIKINSAGEITGSVYTVEEMQDLNKLADCVLQETLNGIASGCVSANPISRGPRSNSCKYCPNYAACHKDATGTKFRYVKELSRDEAMSEVKKRVHRAKPGAGKEG